MATAITQLRGLAAGDTGAQVPENGEEWGYNGV